MELKKRSLLSKTVFALAVSVSIAFGADSRFSSLAEESFVSGLVSYKNGDWTESSILLRQAASSPSYSTDSVWYMIIMSQIYSEKFNAAVGDCDFFISSFGESPLLEAVRYQKGRALYLLGQTDLSVMELSGFCNEFPESGMYSSALFWIAESFYDDYDFKTARSLYEKILEDFPESAKAEDAQFKLYLITQREREEKLLYLLRMTGEEFLSVKENYEKELKLMQSADVSELQNQLRAANSKIRELEEEQNSGQFQNTNEITEFFPAEQPAAGKNFSGKKEAPVPSQIPESVQPENEENSSAPKFQFKEKFTAPVQKNPEQTEEIPSAPRFQFKENFTEPVQKNPQNSGKNSAVDLRATNYERIYSLKKKAETIQKILDEKYGGIQ